jgi:hypothetical protein
MFYNYVYLDPRKPGRYHTSIVCLLFEPIYIGKGKSNRRCSHLSNYHLYESNVNPIKQNKLRKLVKHFDMRSYIIDVSNSNNEEEILTLEKQLISELGRMDLGTGPLTNCDDGGTGTCGRVDSPATIERRSKSLENVYDERRGSTYEEIYGELKAAEIKNKLSRTMQNRGPRSASVRRKISESKRGERNPSSKTFKLTDPHGNEYIITGGLRRFCRENNLSFNSIWNSIDNGPVIDSPHVRRKTSAFVNTIGWDCVRVYIS